MSNDRYDLNNPAAELGEPLRLLYVSRSRYGGDWHSMPHTHHFTELFYVLSGKGRFQVEGDLFELSTDDLVIVNPDVEHTERSQGDMPLEYIVVGLSGQSFCAPGTQDSRFVRLSCTAQREEYLFYFKHIMEEMEQRPPGYEAVCRSLAEVLAAKLMRRTVHARPEGETRKRSRECTKARRYMDENFCENITLDMLAELTHMNKYYLVHAFTREIGCSPINYLIARRIAESKYLLESTDYSMSQISQHLGFSSPSYFSQSFKRIVGRGPSDYRRDTLALRAQKPDR